MTMTRRISKLLRSATIAATLVLGAGALASCDDPAQKTPEQYLELAKSYIAEGDLRAGVIELKNALQLDPENAEARYLLATSYLEQRNASGAEKELKRARDLGVSVKRLTLPQARLLMLQGEMDRLLAESQPNADLSPAELADLHDLRGQAQLRQQRFDDADAEFQAALEAQPNHVGALVGKGKAAMVRGDLDGAERQLAAAREVDADAVAVSLLDGDIGANRRDFARAEAAYQKALDADNRLTASRLGLVWSQLQNGKNKEALANLEPALKRNPHHPTLNFFAALANFQEQNHQVANEQALVVLNANGKHLPSRLIAGTTSYALGSHEQARRHMQVVLAASPDNVHARKVLAASLLALGRADEAAELVEDLELDSANDAQLLSAIGSQVLNRGDHDSSREFFERVVEINPEDASARTNLAAAQLAQGKNQEAIEELKKAIELDPESQSAQVLLIMTYLRDGKYDDALSEAVRFTQETPDSPHGYTLSGMAHAGKGDFDAAIGQFKQALKVKPGDYNASNNLAMVHIAQGEFDTAIALYETVLEHNPDNLASQLKLAELKAQTGRTQEAVDHMRSVLEQDPNNVKYRLFLGGLYLRAGNPLKALDTVESVRVNTPRDPQLLALLGQAQVQIRQLPEAIETYETWVSVQPDIAPPYIGLSWAHEESGNLAKARQQIELALVQDITNPTARLARARLSAKAGELDLAEAQLKSLREANPDNPDVLELAGNIALVRGQPEEALALYEKAWAKRQNALSLAQLARAERAAGRPDAAAQRLRDWVEAHPDDIFIRFVLAEFDLQEGRLEESRDQYLAILERTPDNGIVNNNVAWVINELGDSQEALSYAEKARTLMPNEPSVMDTLAVIYLERGRSEEALDLLRNAVQTSNDPNLQVHLAQALRDSGDRDEAIEVLRAVLSENPSFAERDQAQELLSELDS